jgi:hypothetical protein
MQTKFKWTDKQRLIIISGVSTAVTMSSSLQLARALGEDIYFFAKASAEQINSDERIQKKLKVVFESQMILGENNFYEQFLKLEKETSENDQISFSA